MQNPENIRKILQIFTKTYPDARIALNYGNAWELLVAVILSAQCTDVTVNKVTATLFRKYPEFRNYLNANPGEFETDIKSTGFYRSKAKNILKTAQVIHRKFSDQVPDNMKDMLVLPGVARKTANVVLSNWYQMSWGIAVDTHVARISQRLRLIPDKIMSGKDCRYFMKHGKRVLDFCRGVNTDLIEEALMQSIPKADWSIITYRMIDHGRAICHAVNPGCAKCPLLRICPATRP